MARTTLRLPDPPTEDVHRMTKKWTWRDDEICEGFRISKDRLNLIRASLYKILERHQLSGSNTGSILGRGRSNVVVVDLLRECPTLLENVPEEWGLAVLNFLTHKVDYNAKRRQRKRELKEKKRRQASRYFDDDELPKTKINAKNKSTTKDSSTPANTARILEGVIIRVQREGERHCFSCRPKDLVAFGQPQRENLQIKDIDWVTFHNLLANTWHFNSLVEDLEWSYADGVLSWVGDEITLHAALEAMLSDRKYPMFRISKRERARMLAFSLSPPLEAAPEAVNNARIAQLRESTEVPHEHESWPSRRGDRWSRRNAPLDYTLSSSPDSQQYSESESLKDFGGRIKYPKLDDKDVLHVSNSRNSRQRHLVCPECRADHFVHAHGLLSHSRMAHNIIFKSQRDATLASEQFIASAKLDGKESIPVKKKTKIIVLRANPDTARRSIELSSRAKRKSILLVELPSRIPSCRDPIHNAMHHM